LQHVLLEINSVFLAPQSIRNYIGLKYLTQLNGAQKEKKMLSSGADEEYLSLSLGNLVHLAMGLSQALGISL